MTIKITTPNGGSDSLDFGCAQTPVVATVTGTEVSSGEGKLEFKTTTGGTSATKATVLANGNVGINVAAPTYKLDVNTGTAALGGVAVDLFRSGSLSSSTGGVLNLRPANGAAISNIHNLSIAAYDHSGDTNADGLSINAYDGVSFSTGSNSRQERMRITSAGNVGIGVTNPDLKMEIVDTSSGASKDALLLTNYGAASNTETGIFFSPTEADGAIRGARISALNDGADDSNSVALKFSTGLGAPPVERMRITSAGNVGIGTTPAVPLQIGSAGGVAHNGYTKLSVENGDHCVLAMRSPNDKICQIIFDDVDAVGRGQISYNHNEDSLAFATAATERMRILSGGGVCINTTAAVGLGGPKLSMAFNGGTTWLCNTNDTNGTVGGRHYTFHSNGTEVGKIVTTTSATQYITTSDYRLKENVEYDWDATTRLKQLKPARFNFKINPDDTVDGFLAHEAQEVVPESVTGVKDEVDDDDNPVMQGIDQAKLVPLLVKTIQELEARIAKLEENK